MVSIRHAILRIVVMMCVGGVGVEGMEIQLLSVESRTSKAERTNR